MPWNNFLQTFCLQHLWLAMSAIVFHVIIRNHVAFHCKSKLFWQGLKGPLYVVQHSGGEFYFWWKMVTKCWYSYFGWRQICSSWCEREAMLEYASTINDNTLLLIGFEKLHLSHCAPCLTVPRSPLDIFWNHLGNYQYIKTCFSDHLCIKTTCI